MPRLIATPTTIPVSGGKVISEHVGRAICLPALGRDTINRED